MEIVLESSFGVATDISNESFSFARRAGWWTAHVLPVLIPLGLFIAVGVAGIDFGNHWDELDHIQNVHDSLQTGVFLPMGAHEFDNVPGLKGGYYGYPSVIYWLGVFSAAPQIIDHRDHLADPQLLDYINSKTFLLRFRAVCLVVSSLTILWVYLIVMVLRRDWRLALFAGTLVAGSWEIGYHARWAATDAVVAQFAGLTLLFCCLALRAGPHWRAMLRLGAATAGLAAGTKYPAGLLIIPVLVSAILLRIDGAPLDRRVLRCAQYFFILGIAFLITTPGAVLQPTHFLAWLNYDHAHYGERGHGGYNVASQGEFVLRALQYLVLSLFSRFAIIASALFALGLVGIAAIARKEWKLLAVLLLFPVVYFAYFSEQIVLIVRNLLILAPFLAVLSALGLWAILQRARPRVRWAIVIAVAVGLSTNCAWNAYAAWTIRRNVDPSYQVAQLADYLKSHPVTHFCVTDSVNEMLAANNFPTHPASTGASADVLVMLSSESGRVYQWPANRRDLIESAFGPLEVNFDYYPTWRSNRILLIDDKKAPDIGPAEAALQMIQRRSELQSKAASGFIMRTYLDCGAKDDAKTGNISIVAQSQLHVVMPGTTKQLMSFTSMTFAPADMKFEITGTDASREYVVGIAWWDAWNNGKQQSIYLAEPGKPRQRVLGPLALPAESAREYAIPIPHEFLGKTIELSVGTDVPSDIVVISDVWIYEKSTPGGK